ncbi:hypothetical protein Acr_06g0013750 [Actinidia rufa]|uniref:Uncharacterized protein n=1 Tax=Actinidia rufa TaxID=165716 RepID=A0A7J0ESI8_9ERIC|nr:hypothetical protein Acr_06g0013750 [Actinidia rufa]
MNWGANQGRGSEGPIPRWRALPRNVMKINFDGATSKNSTKGAESSRMNVIKAYHLSKTVGMSRRWRVWCLESIDGGQKAGYIFSSRQADGQGVISMINGQNVPSPLFEELLIGLPSW